MSLYNHRIEIVEKMSDKGLKKSEIYFSEKLTVAEALNLLKRLTHEMEVALNTESCQQISKSKISNSKAVILTKKIRNTFLAKDLKIKTIQNTA